MLVCSCNFITEKDIRDVITSFLDADPWQLIVPGKIYHAMEKRGRCCGCFPNVVDLIVETTTNYHRALNEPETEREAFLARLRAFEQEQKTALSARRSRVA
jgi:bacterioferritin-associated ferredoxin